MLASRNLLSSWTVPTLPTGRGLIGLGLGGWSGSLTDSQEARAVAQAVTSLCKAFADMVTIIRIERGKPLPGSLRPESKPTKRKQQPTMFTENKPE